MTRASYTHEHSLWKTTNLWLWDEGKRHAYAADRPCNGGVE
eukprot:COSAG02_NODE_66959_length_254_cov_0.664516_2_plen_40_part_01